MTEIFNFQSGEFAGKTVRVTKEATPRVSVLDITTIACEQNGNPSLYFARLCDTYPDVRTCSDNFKFPGQGQRDTPVTDARGIVKILMLLPGRKAAAFREKASEVLVRYLGGDEILIREIHMNAVIAQIYPTSVQGLCASTLRLPKREALCKSKLSPLQGTELFFDRDTKLILTKKMVHPCVYVLQHWANEMYFKVGKTGNIITRLSSYSTCEPFPHILRYLKFTTHEELESGSAEQEIFARLSDYRLHPKKEWFGNGVTMKIILEAASVSNKL